MARIVFAKGSKAMAHNLDDLYQRWEVRREEVARETGTDDPEIGLEMFVPDLPDELPPSEVPALRQLLIDKKVYIGQALLDLEKTKYDYGKRGFSLRRASLALASQKIQAQQSALRLIKSAKLVTGSTRVKVLKDKRDTEGLSTEEQAELAMLQFEASQHSDDAIEKHLATRTMEDAERIEKMEDLISDLRKQLVAVQNKLIEAYERVIELENE